MQDQQILMRSAKVSNNTATLRLPIIAGKAVWVALTVAAAAGLAGGGGEFSLLYTLLHRKSSTAVMLARGSISTTLLE